MLNTKKSKIIVILGPTSSGKSEVAIRLAKKFGGEIISADSRQIYRRLDLGTGKVEADTNPPSPNGRGCPDEVGVGEGTFYSEGIPHYLIDIVDPKNSYNAVNFKKDTEIIIADILKRKKLPIICGGTGFWIKAVIDNINFPEVKPNKKLRKALEKYPAEKLFKMLQKLDSERAKNIDHFNKVRLIRAIEICKAIGKVPKIMEHRTCLPDRQARNMEQSFLQIGIKLEKEKLNDNIKKRLKKRFESGIIEEVKKLHSKEKLSWKKIQSFGLGYFWIAKYLKEKVYPVEYHAERDNFAMQNLFNKVNLVEKDYAKRQMTWFKRDKRIKWLINYKEIEKEVKRFIK